ncbi:hypothetical protein EG327_008874 [Venturia inaequalis]|uniref:Uncharacterized protein n=1 Tax=Venturia inaequalis TaxID=5025 RepID=A0A8H3ZAN8_VENIN|nr:hypothetical protein EG327_008874 [Venturia inaequalis]
MSTVLADLKPSETTGNGERDISILSTDRKIIGDDCPGVLRAEVLREQLTPRDRVYVFLSLFLLAYVYTLDGTLRAVFQPYATAGFNAHSTLATINVVRSVIAAAAQPTAAKIADVFGRVELVVVSVVFYIVGTIIEATCHNVEGFAAGAVIYQIGYTSILVLVEVVIADITSTKERLIFAYVPVLPFLLNSWISGDVSEAVLKTTSWRWGIGMFAIIYAAAATPLVLALWWPTRRIQGSGKLDNHPTTWRIFGTVRLAPAVFWQLDVIGIVLLIAVFSLILVPFTIAGGQAAVAAQWSQAKVIAPLVLGVVCIPIWLWWQSVARYPMVPFELLRDRAVWGALGVACMLTFCWYLQGDFLYTVLIVAFDESVKSATRITALYSFCSVLSGAFVGIIVLKYKYLKPFIFIGTTLFFVAFGILIHFRGGPDTASHSGIIGSQILLGIAGGLFPYPTLVSIQVATKKEHVAVITGLYLATYNIGSAFGNAVSGAIWTQTLVPTLLKNLPSPNNTVVVAQSIYGSPFEYVANYSVGSPMRDAIVLSYRHTQKLLTVTGICLCIPLIAFSLMVDDPRLTSEQSLPGAETAEARENRRPWWKVF